MSFLTANEGQLFNSWKSYLKDGEKVEGIRSIIVDAAVEAGMGAGDINAFLDHRVKNINTKGKAAAVQRYSNILHLCKIAGIHHEFRPTKGRGLTLLGYGIKKAQKAASTIDLDASPF